ncbi:hypothetical protein [Massilia antarctica]|uniref:hypothetical protein n=1 Tax=Massilia antarctica TaxID=2765360 RepID=UPI0006BB8A56|nr:hypothetical protein [Massilia sp. H27-R4]MCY0912234.1 hypothetical protein [Massilia sp. H27-R4]CUI06271.1 hypothetical protein BN2497_7319 [Janthinobacterium sp. CG23_2]CUU30057.1 hypothetical protein BN3177_7319 [Janthinobacterium sp. CG23_2]
MTHQELMPFDGIVDQLRHFRDQRRTGTAFIVSDDNRMAQVHMDSGNIVMLLCRGQRGEEAVAAMRTMLRASVRFDDSYVAKQTGTRAAGVNLMDLLNDPAPLGAHVRSAVRTGPQPTRPRAAPAAFAREDLLKLERMLAVHIGPMATIVCAEHASEASDLRILVMALAADIPDKKQAADFRLEAGRALGLGAV